MEGGGRGSNTGGRGGGRSHQSTGADTFLRNLRPFRCVVRNVWLQRRLFKHGTAVELHLEDWGRVAGGESSGEGEEG